MRTPSDRVLRHLTRPFGERLHHRNERVPGNKPPEPAERPTARQGAPPFGSDTIPTYPHPETSSDPLAPAPLAGRPRTVLTGEDVTDYGDADAVADPFLFVTPDGDWHMFFEVVNLDHEPTAVIAHATSPDTGYTWEYDRVVLATDVHLSFPYVFRWRGTTYMLPDPWSKTGREATVSLYRAREFPHRWTRVADLLAPERRMHDSVVFRWEDRWWALLGDEDNLFAFYAADLEADDWHPHDLNPVVTDRRKAGRPGGRPVVRDDHVLVFLQDCVGRYGKGLRAYRVTELTPSTYADHEAAESPVLGPSSRRVGWNSGGMHHMDAWHVGDRWRCAVDGDVGLLRELCDEMWAIAIYESR